MFYCLSIVWILSISGLLTIFFKRKFELVATISIILGTLLMYPFGYINHLSWGFYLSWIFVLLFFGIILKWVIKKENNKLKEFKDNYFTLGLVYFLLVLVYFFLRYKLQGFSYCDEFTHWGPMIKESLRLDGFYSQDASDLIMHKDYPPFFTLMEILFIGFNGFNYSETIAYISIATFMFTCLMPVLSNLDIKNKKDWVNGLIISCLLIAAGITVDMTETASDYALVYNSIYVDWVLAVFATYAIYMTYKENDWGVFKFTFLTLICVSLILMKQMGLVYWLIVLIYAFMKVLFVDRKLNTKTLIKGIIFLIIVPIIVYFSWKYVVNKYEIVQQFNISELSINDFFNIIRGNTDLTWKYEAFRNFLYNIIKRPLKLHPFKMSYFVYVILLIAVMIIGSWFKKSSYYISGTYFIGACGYALAMLLLYTLFFDQYEAPYLASFDRYMCSYLYFGTTLALIFVIENLYKSILKLFGTLCILLLFIEPKSISDLIIRTSVDETPSATITVINQWDRDIKFERENLNGYRLSFEKLDYIYDTEESHKILKDALDKNDNLFIISSDAVIEDYFNEIGMVYDEVYNKEFYIVEKKDGKYTFTWSPFTFQDYVIRYYRMGI